MVREALIYKKWHTLVLDTPLEKLLPESPTWVVSRGKNRAESGWTGCILTKSGWPGCSVLLILPS